MNRKEAMGIATYNVNAADYISGKIMCRDRLKSLTDEEYKHFMDSLEENEELMIKLSNI